MFNQDFFCDDADSDDADQSASDSDDEQEPRSNGREDADVSNAFAQRKSALENLLDELSLGDGDKAPELNAPTAGGCSSTSAAKTPEGEGERDGRMSSSLVEG